MKQLTLNQDNHAEYDLPSNSMNPKFDEMLKLNFELNDMLGGELGKWRDWGGSYSTWLCNLGIDHQSKNGWWSKDAIRMENIELFIKCQKLDDWNDLYAEAVSIISKVRKISSFKSSSGFAIDVITSLTDHVPKMDECR